MLVSLIATAAEIKRGRPWFGLEYAAKMNRPTAKIVNPGKWAWNYYSKPLPTLLACGSFICSATTNSVSALALKF
jgi:hypothetical protein